MTFQVTLDIIKKMKIQPPTECPSCSSPLGWVKDQLYCKSEECGDRQYKAVDHFSKTLKIKGLGPQTIRKLDIRTPSEIYCLGDVSDVLGNKVFEKLIVEIENSKSAPLNMLLPALGIPLIGQTATDKLSKVVNSLYEITRETCKEAGLGEKATNNLIGFLQTFYYELPFSYLFAKKPEPTKSGVVCITGKLLSYKNKAEATSILESLGYTVKSSITKDVTILVNEGGEESVKTVKARESGITIVTNLKQYLGE